MSERVYERIKSNLLALNMKNTLEIIDNYLERAIADKINIVDVLDYILVSEASAKKGVQRIVLNDHTSLVFITLILINN